MNELQRRLKEHKFQHDKGCKFEREVTDFNFDGRGIELRGDDYDRTGYLTIKYCPYCGFDIDASVARMIIIKQRTEELIKASSIKLGDMVWIKRPNNDYWKGRGFKSKVTDIYYDEHFDRLLYRNSERDYQFMSCPIEDIELYTDQPICNP